MNFRRFLSNLHKIWLNIVEWSMVNANVLDFRYVISNFNTGNAQYNWVKVTDINSNQVKTKAQCGLEQEGLLSPTERASVSVISLRPLGQSR